MNTIDGDISMFETLMRAFHFGVTFATAVCCCLIIVVSAAAWKTNEAAPKSHWIHNRKVPRLGGVVIIVGVISLVLVNSATSNSFAHSLVLSSGPLILMGLSEDIGVEINPSIRIVAGFSSGFIAVFLTGIWINKIDVPFLDFLLTIPLIAIPLSAFASTTIAHSFNLIDGLNGLCSGLSMLALLFFGALAFICGDSEIFLFTMLAASCVLGFWLINLATSRIFLGDAGAYFLGHLAAWTAIVLAARYPIISPWALFLGLIYPISETLVTISRRFFAGDPITAPDTKHLHYLIYRWFLSRTRLPERVANGATGTLIVVWSGFPAIVAVFNFKYSITCFSVALICFLANILAYRYLQVAIEPIE